MILTRIVCAASALLFGGAAFAQTPPACTGKDLIAALQRDDPGAYAKLVEASGKIPNAEGLLYRIEKPGAPPSYLFGTMHVTDDRLAELPAEAKSAIQASKTVALELDEIALDKAGMQAKMGRQFAERGIDPAHQGLDAFREDDRALVKKALADRGLGAVPAEAFKPWVLLMFVSMPSCEMARAAAGLEVVDARIAKAGQAAGASIVGLEEVEEQIDALDSISPEVAARLVTGMLKLGPAFDDAFETMIGLYQRRQIGYLFGDLSMAGVAEDDMGSFFEFMEILVDRRNVTMHDRALPLIDKGNAFIAVGALHLVGEKGLVELFRKSGHTVTRVW
jgi:uncharacterized protein YbaP (TraB family)